ncbi:MAG: ethanolamine utilization protein EutA, partial [Chloroflexota bacterium]|nr:ethanolamine utilization protein EutA [Chloroflexota bacterium]
IGGGTTKLSLIREGIVLQTAAVSVGARLVAFDKGGDVTRIEEPGAIIAAELGIPLALGKPISEADQERIATRLNEILFEVVNGGPYSARTQEFMLTENLVIAPNLRDVQHIVCSGGVSEYVYERETTTYGDLGPRFGRAIRQSLASYNRPGLLDVPAEGIRATVIGAGEYTVQASGTTTYVSNHASLPVFGLQVIRPILENGDSVEDAIQGALAKVDLRELIPGLAIAVLLEGQQNYQSLRRLAEGIAGAAGRASNGAFPLYLVLNQDVARSLGGILHEELELGRDVIVLDGIDVGDLEYVDVGRPIGASQVLPVTVKSLLFPAAVPV